MCQSDVSLSLFFAGTETGHQLHYWLGVRGTQRLCNRIFYLDRVLIILVNPEIPSVVADQIDLSGGKRQVSFKSSLLAK
jgi:hypothetical protein